jgi:TatD DNase family protein
MLIDSHAHLEMREFDNDRDEVVRRAKETGVDAIVTVGTNLRECRKAVALAAQYDAVYAALGIHPHDVKSIDEKTYSAVRELVRQPKVVAYGEIGLDFFRNRSPRDVQIRFFGEQLEMADEFGLPVIIHDREAHAEILKMLASWKGKRGGDAAMAKKCLDMGFYISIAGPVTYPKSDRLLEVVRQVPLNRLLVETDAPYLTPQPYRGKRNEPVYVVHTAKRVAEVKGLTLADVGAATSKNARAIFGIP